MKIVRQATHLREHSTQTLPCELVQEDAQLHRGKHDSYNRSETGADRGLLTISRLSSFNGHIPFLVECGRGVLLISKPPMTGFRDGDLPAPTMCTTARSCDTSSCSSCYDRCNHCSRSIANRSWHISSPYKADNRRRPPRGTTGGSRPWPPPEPRPERTLP